VLRAHLKLTEEGQANPKAFAEKANAAFGALTSHPLKPEILQEAFGRLELTVDPLEPQLKTAATRAKELGFIDSDDLSGMVDLTLLNEVRAEK
jgi:NitT/TauT family transport system substrate-binding protein